MDNSGQILRTSNIRTYTEGDDNQERKACGQAALQQSVQVSSSLRAECVCSSDSDPVLQLVLMTQRFEEVKKVNLLTFTDGDDNQERRSCEIAVQSEAVCQLN